MNEPSQELEQRTPAQELVARVRGDQFKQQIQLALPGNVTPERFVRATVTAVMENPDVAQAEPDSIFQAVIRCAQDGLLPDGREAALVVFNTKTQENGRDVWVKKAQYLPMIGGYRKIAAEHGWSIRTQVVYENDEFEYELGLEPTLVHRPAPLRVGHGDPIGAYSVGTHKDGRKLVEVLTAEDIEKVRKASRAANSGPWRDWTDRMWEKTAGRRLFSKLPLADSERVARVLDAEVEPAEAAVLMYGPAARAAFPQLPPASSAGTVVGAAHVEHEPAAPPAAGPGTTATDERQQAGVAAPSTDAAAPVPGDQAEHGPEPGDEPTPFTSPTDASPEAVEAQQAGELEFTSGKHKGLTIREVAAKDEGYIRWAVKGGWKAEAFRAQLLTFARVYLPDAYQEAMAASETES